MHLEIAKMIQRKYGILYRTDVSTPPSNVDADGHILTKPNDVANHFANYFVSKVNMLRENHCAIN